MSLVNCKICGRPLTFAMGAAVSLCHECASPGQAAPGVVHEDTKRLDWLGTECYSMIPDDRLIVVTRADDGHAFNGYNLREAVDAAMSAAPLPPTKAGKSEQS